jgi:hypothetical protein
LVPDRHDGRRFHIRGSYHQYSASNQPVLLACELKDTLSI